MKHVGNAYGRVASLLREYVRPLGMLCEAGPLRAVRELTAGVVFTGSVQLTNAARLFATTPNQLAGAVERIGGRLADAGWDHREWAAAVLQLQADAVAEDDLIAVDGTELAKPYARRMQYRCTVKDASRVGDPLVTGYWCWGAYHWDVDRGTLNPLMLRPYSPNQPDFRSENELICRWLWTLRQATAGRGIWLMDRGGDRPEVLSALLRVQKRWVVRLREDRPLLGPGGRLMAAGRWADWALANRGARGNAVTLAVGLPPEQVPQYGTPPNLHLVVPTHTFIRSGKVDRWVLLTCGLIGRHVGPRQVRYHYALRWRAEDGKRFLGQVCRAEKFMTRSFLALERTLWCATLAGGFLAHLQRTEPQLAAGIEQEVLYWDKDVVLPVYRLARGLHALAARHGPAALAVNA
jgi:hypothetical protein